MTIAAEIAIIADQRGPIRDYLGNLPADTKLYPMLPHGCILHGLLSRRYQIAESWQLRVSYYDVSAIIDHQEITVHFDGTLWERVQRAWDTTPDGINDCDEDYIYPATALAILEATN